MVKAIKTPNIPNNESNLTQVINTLEAKEDKRKNNTGIELLKDNQIKFRLQKFIPLIYKFYGYILRSNNKQYVDLKYKISERILDKFVPDLKTTDDRPNVANFQFVIGYDTKQIESMDSKAIEGQVEAN